MFTAGKKTYFKLNCTKNKNCGTHGLRISLSATHALMNKKHVMSVDKKKKYSRHIFSLKNKVRTTPTLYKFENSLE